MARKKPKGEVSPIKNEEVCQGLNGILNIC